MTDVFSVMNRSEDVVEKEQEKFTIKKASPFDFLNSINSGKDIFEGHENPEVLEKEYTPWIVNRGLSHFADTIFMANFTNRYYLLDNKLQYDYLINTIRPKKRISKWWKKEHNDDIELIEEAYGYSARKAEAALAILSSDDIKTIRKTLNKGGIKKNEAIYR